MSNTEIHGPELDIAREFGDEAAQCVTANLLPFTGPSYDDLVESRTRWLAGESIKPAALHVATFALTSVFRADLADTLRPIEYGLLHNGMRTSHLQNDPQVGDMTGTQLMHRVAITAAEADARFRGLEDPLVGAYTFGGMLVQNVYTIHKHVDNRKGRLVELRYVMTPIGSRTNHWLERLSIADVDDMDEVFVTPEDSQPLETLDEGQVALTLFELHTPHSRPSADGLPRLFTTIGLSKKRNTSHVQSP